jgi:ferritin-like metal-binding protein YciE
MTIKEKIIQLFETEKELTVKEITNKLSASKQMVHLILKKLVEKKQVQKLGRTPKTIYRIIEISKNIINTVPKINHKKNDYLKQHFLVITEIGEMLIGIEAFHYWCEKRNQPTLKTLDEFIKTKQKYNNYYDKNQFINGTNKLTKTYKENTFLDQVFYIDFYAIERFGKTRLGTLLHFAKQGQNKYLMRILVKEIKEKINTFIKLNKIEAVGFVAPTIKRETQIMKFIQENLNITLPILNINKISGIIPIPQKSLSKIEERINNAKNTFSVTDQRVFKKILLIDDAVGSGATLNHIAEKFKIKKIAKQVIGLAIVGSFKGFDVITDI